MTASADLASRPAEPPDDRGGIEFDAVSVRYPGRREPALLDLSAHVGRGELVGITGRTGAGKSTLTLVAAGFIPRIVRGKVGGSVTFGGRSVVNAPSSEVVGRVGIIFATPASQLSGSKITVREELAFGLENLGVPRAEMDARIRSVLERLAIEQLAEREPFTLSGGEQQRVAIASIVVMGCEALVLDEPTAQLDPAGKTGVAQLIAELARSGATVLCAEHDPLVLRRTVRTILLEQGRLVLDVEPSIVLGREGIGAFGMQPPTLVQLAEAAGLRGPSAFDELALAGALRKLFAGRLATPGPNDSAVPRPPVSSWDLETRDDPPAIEIRGLVHRYPGGLEAVKDVDLCITPGETVAIVGQNGAGKTTLAKHLNGLLRATAGEVLIGGVNATRERIDRLAATVGLVFQNPDDQLFERSVERELRFGPRNLGRSPAGTDRLVTAALSATALDAERATNPFDLPPSTRKLVAIAGVVAMNPAILVLDEPTAGQDWQGVQRVASVVAGFKAAGRTVIAITHDMEFAANHFDRIVVMRGGRIIADGAPASVFGPGSVALLASTGLEPPPAARVAIAMGIEPVPLDAPALLAALNAGVPG